MNTAMLKPIGTKPNLAHCYFSYNLKICLLLNFRFIAAIIRRGHSPTPNYYVILMVNSNYSINTEDSRM